MIRWSHGHVWKTNPVPFIFPTSVYVGWQQTNAGFGPADPLVVNATLRFTRFEQKDVLQPIMDKIHALMPIEFGTATVVVNVAIRAALPIFAGLLPTVSIAFGSMLATFAKNPLDGEPHFWSLYPAGDLTNFSERFDWITTDILPAWSALGGAGRILEDAPANAFLASLYRTPAPALVAFVGNWLDPLHIFH